MPTHPEVMAMLRHAIIKTLVVCSQLTDAKAKLAKIVGDEKVCDRAAGLILGCMLRDLVRDKPSNKELIKLLDEITELAG